jgi:hypothetical protein
LFQFRLLLREKEPLPPPPWSRRIKRKHKLTFKNILNWNSLEMETVNIRLANA